MGSGLELLEVDRCEELRVDAGDVVALDEIVGIDFPVGVEVHRLAADRVVRLDGLVGEFGDEVTELRNEVFLRIDGDEEQATPGGDVDRLQRPVGRIEARLLAEPWRVDEMAVIGEDPLVIGAADGGAAACPLLQQLRAAVAADITEGAEFTVTAADGENLDAGDVGGNILAALGNLGRGTKHLPGLGEDLVALARQHGGIDIEARIEVEHDGTPSGEEECLSHACYSISSITWSPPPFTLWAREAWMNSSTSPSSTSPGAVEVWPVRRSFTS